MGAPKTPIGIAPSDTADLIGTGIPSADLISRLRKINPRIQCPDIDDNNHIDSWHGVTSLWTGDPGMGGKPICGIRLGVIPEWTMIDENGILITKGWRAIFERIIRAGVATQAQIEAEFKIDLSVRETDYGLCPKCAREGKREPSNGGKRAMCDYHDGVYAAVERAKATSEENEERANFVKEKIYVS